MYYNDFMKKLRWQQFTQTNINVDLFFVIQTVVFDPNEKRARKQLCPPHTHDYAEIFWIQSGMCYHKINNSILLLEEGNLIIVRPTDIHSFKFFHDTIVEMTNVVILPETLEFLQMRYLGPEERLYESGSSQPPVYKLTRSQLKWIQTASKELARSKQSLLSIEKFLVDLIYRLSFHESAYGNTKMPDWLAQSCKLIKEQKHFSKGVKEFVHLSAHCAEHVSREIKKWTGRTTTEIVNDARMDYASHELVTTNGKIVNIAYDCGYESVSYFYRIFEKHFGVSPRTYRIKNRTM